MAIQITSQLGTDRGITSEAYVRIVNYSISKAGSANFQIQLFLKKDDAITTQPNTPYMSFAVNHEIGSNLYVPLLKEVETVLTKTRTLPQQIDVEKQVPQLDENNEPVLDKAGKPVMNTITVKETSMVEEEYTETIKTQVPDMSPLEGVDIFEFGYSKLNDHLAALYGAENIIDC